MQTNSRTAAASRDAGSSEARAREILQRIFRDCKASFAVRLDTAPLITFGAAPPAFTLTLTPEALRKLILSPDPLVHAESYVSGAVDFDGDIYAALAMREFLSSLRLSLRQKVSLLRAALSLRKDAGAQAADDPEQWRWEKARKLRHSRGVDRKSIGFHYDVSNDFYRLWLDKNMVYSCAYFPAPDATLDEAQEAKLDLICRKLCLKPGDRFLDIGCGWGALVMWAAAHYGVEAHGVTLSRNQYDYAIERIREAGLADRVTVELKDYRDIAGQEVFDRIASVGMFEHVGIKNLPAYFAAVHRLLKPDGLFLNHGITQDQEAGTRSVGQDFIRRYVFPNSELDLLANTLRTMEQGMFEIHDVESLRAHYALTLRHWVARLEAHAAEAHNLVPAAVYRVWRMYMAGCALGFETAELGVYQVLAAKRRPKLLSVPLTRSFMTTRSL